MSLGEGIWSVDAAARVDSVHSLLTDALIRVRLTGGGQVRLSLPEIYVRLAADDVVSFPALRPHQRHPWHALLCQLGAIACLRSGVEAPPGDAAGWAAILAALTPEYPAGEPWQLIAPPDQPAFLQPPAGPLEALKPVATPDELDMLVTAKNHDLKAARIGQAQADDWLFALVALQTSEGYLGAGNFGVSRMNGGFGNRPGIGLAPPGGPGKHVMRDITRLIVLEDDILDLYPEYEPDGLALLWLEPWDGTSSRQRAGLQPYYVEICRRVRLLTDGDLISARVGNSKAARITMSKDEGGITGDPWTPIITDGDAAKALSIEGRGFNYRRLAGIITGDGGGVRPAPLQEVGHDEDGDGWSLLCRAMARGQGKTEGYHERRVAIPRKVLRRIRRGELPEIGSLCKQRIAQASAVRGALRFGLMTLFQNGPEAVDTRDPSSSRHADRYLERFQADVDQDFFERLFEEASEADEDRRVQLRSQWLRDLLARATAILRSAEAGSPTSTVRRHRAIVRAQSALERAFHGAEDLKRTLQRTHHAA